MQFYAFHGFYEEEQKIGNDFIVNIEVEVKTFDSFEDNIGDTVNYETIYAICVTEMKMTQKLLETVAFRIAKQIKDLDRVASGIVSLSKKSPPMGDNIEAATIEMSF